ncbi:MAG TPA: hypothetical protein VFM55_18165 [Micromonosporaceae bacterium]|nr:hypothetical protein [Micromonosporaceae bacterium]
MNTVDNAVLNTPLQRFLVLIGAFGAWALARMVFAAVVTAVTLRVGGFHELDPAGTALRVGAAVGVWGLGNFLLWAARHWRDSTGVGFFLRTGRSEKPPERVRWSRALWWTGDAVAMAVAVFGVLLLRFPDEPSVWWAAATVLVMIKILQAVALRVLNAVSNMINREVDRQRERRERAQRPSDPMTVPVDDILSPADIAGRHAHEPRQARD